MIGPVGGSRVQLPEFSAASQLGDLRGEPSCPPKLDSDWRIAEEGTRVLSKRCSCPRPIMSTDSDDFSTCTLCGREPSVRLGPVTESRNGAGRANGPPAAAEQARNN